MQPLRHATAGPCESCGRPLVASSSCMYSQNASWSGLASTAQLGLLHPSLAACGPSPLLPLPATGFPRPLHADLYGPVSPSGGATSFEASVVSSVAHLMREFLGRPSPAEGPSDSHDGAAPRLNSDDVTHLATFLLRLFKESTAAWCYRRDVPRLIHEKGVGGNAKRRRVEMLLGAAVLRQELGAKQAMWAQQQIIDTHTHTQGDGYQPSMLVGSSWADIRSQPLLLRRTHPTFLNIIGEGTQLLQVEAGDVVEAAELLSYRSSRNPD